MNNIDLAVAFVFVCNVVFLLAGALVLHRLIRQSEDGQVILLAAAQRSEAASKHLREVAWRAQEQAGKGGTDGRAAALVVSEIERLQGQANDLVRRLAALLNESRAAPAGASDVPGELAFQELTAQNRALRDRMERLRQQLAQSSEDVNAARQWASFDPEGPDVQMQQQLIDQLTQCIDALRAQLDDQPPGADPDRPPGDTADLRAALSVAEDEIGQLRHEVDGLRDLIGRTIREKDFIEDRFLVLDRALVEADAQPASG